MATKKKQPAAGAKSAEQEEDVTTANSSTEEDGSNDEETTTLTWETFLADQDPAIKALYEAHTSGLKNTAKATRKERDALSDQLKALSAQAKEQPELQKKIDTLLQENEAATRKGDFMAEAYSQGCKNPKAAYALAISEDFFTSRGLPDWEALKEEAPELFKDVTSLEAGAGEGNSHQKGKKARTTQATSMNDYIRGVRRGRH